MPLKRSMGLRRKVRNGQIKTKALSALSTTLSLQPANCLRNPQHISVRLTRQTNHEVELNFIPACKECCFHTSQQFFVSQPLINDVPHPLSSGLWSKGKTRLPSASQD